jgi:hypothetical protein
MSQPAKKFRIGNVTATIWKNTAENGNSFYSVNLQRSYKDGDEWKNADGLGHGDLLNASMALTRAEAWIAQQ